MLIQSFHEQLKVFRIGIDIYGNACTNVLCILGVITGFKENTLDAVNTEMYWEITFPNLPPSQMCMNPENKIVESFFHIETIFA